MTPSGAPPYAVPRTTPAMPGAGYVTPAPPLPPPSMAGPPAALGPRPARRPPSGHRTAWTVVALVVGGLVFAAVVLRKFELPKRTDVAVAQVDAGTEPASAMDAAVLAEPIGADAGAVVRVIEIKSVRAQSVKREPVKHEPVKHEPVKREPAKAEPVKETKAEAEWLTRMPDTKIRPKDPPAQREPPPVASALSGLYSGRIHNLSTNMRTTGRLLLNVSGASVTGFLTVNPPLAGSGPVTGTASGNQVTLRVKSAYGTIDMRGVVLGRTLTGGYTAGAATGVQRGTFTMRRQ